MKMLWTLALANAGSALFLALGALLASRWIRRPEVVHALWLVVLLDLLVPPVVGIGVLPHGSTSRAAVEPTRTLALALPFPGVVTSPLPLAGAANVTDLADVLAGLWIVGACAVLVLALARTLRFRRLLAGTEDAPRELREAAATVARHMGLTRCPQIRIVPARISPMLRPRVGGPEVLFPGGLLAQLPSAERDAILAHEFAHVRRRDHWVRFVELLASCLFFWHPAVWWARRRLHRAEERCCDAAVVRALPELASALARGLVSTVEFLNPTPEPLPCLASGVLGVEDMKGRLTMILKPHSLRPLSPLTRLCLSAAATTVLLVFPTRASDEAAKPDCPTLSAEQERHQRQLTEELRRERMAVGSPAPITRRLTSDLDRARAEADAQGQAVARRQYEALMEAQRQAEFETAHKEIGHMVEEIKRHNRRLQLELERETERAVMSREQSEMDQARRQMELAQVEAFAQDSVLREVQEQIEAVMHGAARLEAQGRRAELEELSRHLDELRRDVERAAEAQ